MKTTLRSKFWKFSFQLTFTLLLIISLQSRAQNCDYWTNYGNGTYVSELIPNANFQTYNNNLSVGNCQWYYTYVTAGYQYTYKTGCSDGASATFDTYLRLYDYSTGTLLLENDDVTNECPNDWLQSKVVYTATFTGWLIIDVASFQDSYGGDYNLAYNVILPCNAIAEFTTVVHNDTVDFFDATSGTVSTYNWDFGDGFTSSSQNPQHIYVCSGSYPVFLTITEPNTCQNVKYQSVDVTVPNGSLAQFTSVISGNQVTFTSTSIGSITTYDWDFGDGGSHGNSANPVKTYSCAGNYYNVTLTTTDVNACVNTSPPVTITAEGDPQAFFSVSSVFGDSINLTSGSTGNNLQYNYDFGDGTAIDTNQNPSHRYACPGDYTISLYVVSQGPICTSETFTFPITIVGSPHADFRTNTTGGATYFYSASIGSIATYDWYFGDGQLQLNASPNTSHSYSCPGTYFIKLVTTAVGGCRDSITQGVGVTGDPIADFTYSAAGTVVDFTDNSTSGSALTYHWYFGDGAEDNTANPQHDFICGGYYYVSLQVVNLTNCTTFVNKQIYVIGDPNPSFSAVVTGNNVSFTNFSTGSLASIFWDFGDGESSNQSSIGHQYACPGDYTVYLYVTGTNGCSVYDYQTVSISGSPVADYSYIAAGTNVTFTNTSTGTGLSYEWNFDDGSTSNAASPTHTYTCGGSYYVTLSISNGTCGSYTSQYVEVVGDPYASYDYDVQGTQVNFTSTAIGNITNTFWLFYTDDFSLYSTSDLANPQETFANCGNINVYMQVSNGSGCYHGVSSTISLPDTRVLQLDTSLSALASGETYQWIDCNGNTPLPNETNQTFNASVNGSYAVIVTAGSCSDTSDCTTITTVGIVKDITQSTVSVYPNPFNNSFMVKTDGTGHLDIQVNDMLGREVYTKQVTGNGGLIQVIDLSGQTNGVYELKIRSLNGGLITRKLVKQ